MKCLGHEKRDFLSSHEVSLRRAIRKLTWPGFVLLLSFHEFIADTLIGFIVQKNLTNLFELEMRILGR